MSIILSRKKERTEDLDDVDWRSVLVQAKTKTCTPEHSSIVAVPRYYFYTVTGTRSWHDTIQTYNKQLCL